MRRLFLALLVCAAPAAAQTAPPAPAIQVTGAFYALSVPDIEAARAWYEDKLGLRVTRRHPPSESHTVMIMEGNGLILELIQNRTAQSVARPTDPTGVHGVFKVGVVVADYDAVLARLRERGVTVLYGPFPAREDQRANFIIADNSGNLLQIFAR